ncbi:hypothetical protein NUU61_002263 [Penicillium alfredii]|uniref:Uncharacterized protein n=1 Tax=Penicillium alfredii TaxID=1506179 RepID=A0A9W9FR61_9EURO|nr:uncharacterized protein NUU61_002263 [Penicillium alfredii]KAJ5104916.1 hypothetical protein NUU61_002263 [Penicillium alfredii]
MQVARKAGFPVRRVIGYGEHPDAPHAPVSILLTRVPGEELGQVYETLGQDKQSILRDLRGYFDRIRSALLWVLQSGFVRIPNYFAGPFESEQEFNEYLLGPSWSGGFRSKQAYHDTLMRMRAKRIEKLSRRIVFTHGDPRAGEPRKAFVLSLEKRFKICVVFAAQSKAYLVRHWQISLQDA